MGLTCEIPGIANSPRRTTVSARRRSSMLVVSPSAVSATKVISPMIELMGPISGALTCSGSATFCTLSATTWRAR